MNAATPKVMLLIDADNVSADVMEQAVQKVLAEHGALHVRRAYCTAEAALKHQALFKRLSVRPMVNLAAGKNSTDIALAVDALDLVIAERPQVVYLVSSDSDFAPLVIRLREKGCRVCGIGQQGKTGDETVGVYDAFTDLEHKAGRQAAAPSLSPAPAPARKARAKPTAKTAAAKTAPAAKKTATRSSARKTAAAPQPAPASEAAEFILQAVPALRTGREVALNDAAQALRAAGLLGKHGSSLKLFDKLTDEFAVLQHPDRIRWTGAPAH